MKTAKAFDCVALKNAIQAQILKEREGISDADVRGLVQRKLETSNTPVGRLWRTIQAKQGTTKQ
jgi:hypothetical protein